MNLKKWLYESLISLYKTMHKRKSVILALSCVMVFVTTYMLILPAFTLDKEEAAEQGGIGVTGEEQSVRSEDEQAESASTDAAKQAAASKDESSTPSNTTLQNHEDGDTSVEAENKDDNISNDEQSGSRDLEAAGDDYKIVVEFDDAAMIPDSTKLVVEELEFGSDEYLQCLGRLWTEVNKEYYKIEEMRENYDESMGILPETHMTNINMARFFDISLVNNDTEFEPGSPAKVEIIFEDGLKATKKTTPGVVHFVDENKIDIIKDVDTVTQEDMATSFKFEQASFSVVGTFIGQETQDIITEPDTPASLSASGRASINDVDLSEDVIEDIIRSGAKSKKGLRAVNAETSSSEDNSDLEKPTGNKTLKPNKDESGQPDGTYTLTLSVKGHSKTSSEDKTKKANILFVMDRSSSMITKTVNNDETFWYYGTWDTSNTTFRGDISPNNYQFYGLVDGQYVPLIVSWSPNNWNYTYVRYQSGTDWWGNPQYEDYPSGDPLYVRSKTTRMVAEQNALNNLFTQLLDKNDADNDDNVELAVISFGDERFDKKSYSDETEADWTGGRDTSTLSTAVSSNRFTSGTNWQDALDYAHEIISEKKANDGADEDYYVVFLTDGEPTAIKGESGGAHHTGDAGNLEAYNAAKDDAKKLVDDGFQFYNIFTYRTDEAIKYSIYLTNYAYGNGDYNASLETDAAQNYFSDAKEPDDVVNALKNIFYKVEESIGHGNVSITDTLTTDAMTTTIVHGKTNGYVYTVTDNDDSVLYTVTAEGDLSDPTVTFNVPSSSVKTYTAESTEIEGKKVYSVTTVEGETYKMALADVNDESGKLEWDLSPVGVLLDGCTYNVSFIVWPDQDAYDYVAALNNADFDNELTTITNSHGEEVIVKWDDDRATDSGKGYMQGGVKEYPSIVKYPDGTFAVLTNTDQQIHYSVIETKTVGDETDTTVTGPYYSDLPTPRPMPLEASMSNVEKQWSVDRDEKELAKLLYPTDGSHYTLTFDIMQDSDEDPYTSVNLGWDETKGEYVWEKDSEKTIEYNGRDVKIGTRWVRSFSIATGLMLSTERMNKLSLDKNAYTSTVYKGKTYYILEHGHDYTISEPGLSYEYDFVAPVYHPMLVDGVLKNVDFDEDGSISDITGIEVNEDGVSTLKIENKLRAYIKLNKVVLDENGDPLESDDTKFNYTITLNNDPGEGKDGPFTGTHIPWFGISGLYYHDKDDNYYQGFEAADGTWKLRNEDGDEFNITSVFHPDQAEAQEIRYNTSEGEKTLTLYGNQTTASADGKTATADFEIVQGQELSIANVPLGTTYRITEAENDAYVLNSITTTLDPADESEQKVSIDGSTIEGTIVPDHDNHITFTNKVKPRVTVKVKKAWDPVPEDSNASVTVELHRYAKKTKGTFTVTVKDQYGASVPGATIVLYKDDDTYGSYTTDENGVVSVTNLEPGTYRYEETEAPVHYSMGADSLVTDSFVVKDNETQRQEKSVELLNQIEDPAGVITLTVKDDAGEPIEGAVFDMYDQDGLVEQKMGLRTDSEGKLVVTGLEPGTYYFQQVSTPYEYKMPSESKTDSVTVKDEPGTQLFDLSKVNTRKGLGTATVTLSKESDGTPISGAKFELWKGSAKVEEATTDDNGHINFGSSTKLDPGTYTVKQISTGADLEMAEDQTFVIEDTTDQNQENTLTFTNRYKSCGNAVVTVVKASDNSPISGAEFELLKDGVVITGGTSDSNGQITFGGTDKLGPGTYTVMQKSTADGYRVSSDQSFTIEDNHDPNQQFALTFKNEAASGNVTLNIWKGDRSQWDNNRALLRTFTGLKAGTSYTIRFVVPTNNINYGDSMGLCLNYVQNTAPTGVIEIPKTSWTITGDTGYYDYSYTPQQNNATYNIAIVSNWGLANNSIVSATILDTGKSANGTASNKTLLKRSAGSGALQKGSAVSEDEAAGDDAELDANKSVRNGSDTLKAAPIAVTNASPASSPGEDFITDAYFVKTYTLTAEDEWIHEFDPEDKYDADGNPYYYYVVETAWNPSDYYIESYSGDPLNHNGTITVTDKQKTGSLKITKNVTVDGKSTTGTLADGTYVFNILKSDGSAVTRGKVNGETITNGQVTIVIKNGVSNTVEVTDLPIGTYTIREETPANGTTLTSGNDVSVTVEAGKTGDAVEESGTAEFTNNAKTTSINVSKVWDPDSPADHPTSVTFKLYRAGTYQDGTQQKAASQGFYPDENTVYTINGDDATTISGLPEKAIETIEGEDRLVSYTYRVVEMPVNGYRASYDIDGIEYTITNTPVTEAAYKTDLELTKAWEGGESGSNHDDDKIEFKLTQNAVKTNAVPVTVLYTTRGNSDLVIREDYYVTKGTELQFTFTKATNALGSSHPLIITSGTSSETIPGAYNMGSYTWNKVISEPTVIEAQLQYERLFGALYDQWGDEAVTYQLRYCVWTHSMAAVSGTVYSSYDELYDAFKDGQPDTDVSSITTYTMDRTNDPTTTVTPAPYNVANTGDWAAKFSDLPQMQKVGNDYYIYTYEVSEIKIINADNTEETVGNTANTSYDGESTNYYVTWGKGEDGKWTITNTEKEKIDVTADKKWLNADGSETPPEGASITFELFADGVATGKTVVLNGKTDVAADPNESQELISTAGNNASAYESAAWTAKWEKLPKYKSDGETLIVYTIKEVVSTIPSGYEADYGKDSGDVPKTAAENGGVITNKQLSTSLKIIKVNSKDMTTPISGALFELRKVDPSNPSLEYLDTEATLPTTNGSGHKTGEDGIAVFTGITEGYYEVTEAEIPEGYIKTGEGAFYIKVENGVVSHVNRTVTEDGEGVRHVVWTPGSNDDVFTFSAASGNDPAEATIGNEPGAELPHTGGPGTRVFTILGAVLTLIAGGLLLLKRKHMLV
ncbi:MAG: Cna B-type domain-containing protein [Bacteroidales bacterium]|nr:Cna B-type domain-containing protein [Bacteroidales bacterium]